MPVIELVRGKTFSTMVILVAALAFALPMRADVRVSPRSVSFGSRSVSAGSSLVTVTLTNTGRSNVRLTDPSVSPAPFYYEWGPSGPVTLRPNRSVTVGIRFRPAAAGTFRGALAFDVRNGRDVNVPLSGTATGSGSGSSPAAPSISTHPANRTVTAGQTAAFSVTAAGTAPLGYQWRKNGANIAGATSSSYTTPAAVAADTGAQFTVVVSNSAGGATSNAATLTVNPAQQAPTIVSHPPNRTVTAGQTAAFSVTASGAAPLSYQWRKNGGNIAGATSSNYTTPATAASDSGTLFTVVVSNSAGNATSNPGALTVNAVTRLMSLNPTSLNFGNVGIGSSNAARTVTLTNSGNGNVTVSSVTFSGPGFSVSGVSSGQILAPGQTGTLNVSFVPAGTGAASGTITVTSNASNSPSTVSISGAGVQTTSRRVLLSWIASPSSVMGYYVYSATAAGGPYTKLTPSAVTTQNHTDGTVQSGRTYYYVVTAVNSSGVESIFSAEASAVIP